MSSKIDAAVLAKIKSGQDSLNVEVQFSEPPPAGQVEAMGLKREGNLVWGVLNKERIEGLASVPQVTSVRLSNRPVEPRAVVPRESRIGRELQLAMEQKDRKVFDVVVSFRRPQKRTPPIEGLSVDLDMGSGWLTREGIASLADNDEVLRIELAPKMHLA